MVSNSYKKGSEKTNARAHISPEEVGPKHAGTEEPPSPGVSSRPHSKKHKKYGGYHLLGENQPNRYYCRHAENRGGIVFTGKKLRKNNG